MSVQTDDSTIRSVPAAGEHSSVLVEYLSEVTRRGASDLLLVAGAPPTVYSRGQWQPLGGDRLLPEEVRACIDSWLTDAQKAILSDRRDLDVGLSLPGVGRYRVNVHYQRGTLAAAFRAIPMRVPPFERLGLFPGVLRLGEHPNGLVLVTGGTGQGKSTTIAALLEHMNQTRCAHVVTIEDPIEFLFEHGTCLIEQREIGDDSPSFGSALRHVLRQRPDVIVIGEMRDLETIATALTAAETGHLVLASLHTSNAAQTLARIVDVFPPAQQPQIRTQVAGSLRAILCQALVRDRLNDGLTPATEFLVATSAVRRAIRDNETHLIYSMLETGKRHEMHTMEQSLAELVEAGRVHPSDAFSVSTEPSRLEKLIRQPAPSGGVAASGSGQGRAEPIEIPWNGNPV